MTAGERLDGVEARQVAAFLLGVPVDATDAEAAAAFRAAAHRTDPATGGNRQVHAAVLAAWAMWHRTGPFAGAAAAAAGSATRIVHLDHGGVVPGGEEVVDGELLTPAEVTAHAVARLPEEHRRYVRAGVPGTTGRPGTVDVYA